MAAALLLPTQTAAQSAGGIPQKFATPGFDFSNPERVVEIAEKIFASYGHKIQRDKIKIDFEAETENNPATFQFTLTDTAIDAYGQKKPKIAFTVYTDTPTASIGREFHAGTHTRGIKLIIHHNDIKGAPITASVDIYEDLYLGRLRVEYSTSILGIDNIQTSSRIVVKQFASSTGNTSASLLELETAELFVSYASQIRAITPASNAPSQEIHSALITYELTERGEKYNYVPSLDSVLSYGRENLPAHTRKRMIAEFVPTSLIAAKQNALALIDAAKDAGLFGPVPTAPAARPNTAPALRNDKLK